MIEGLSKDNPIVTVDSKFMYHLKAIEGIPVYFQIKFEISCVFLVCKHAWVGGSRVTALI